MCRPIVLIGVLSAIWLRPTLYPEVASNPMRSRGDTEPKSWPASEAWRSTVKLLPSSFSATWPASLKGGEEGLDGEFRQFLNMAQGSTYEVQTQLLVAKESEDWG